jgi:nucleotide-binding universal stress UspA family protein
MTANDALPTPAAIPLAGASSKPARVVVGLDGSAGSATALRWAADEARLRQCSVHVVLAWQFHPSWGDPGLGTMFPLGYGAAAAQVAGMPVDLSSDVNVSNSPFDGDGVVPGSRRDAEAAMDNVLDQAIVDATQGIDVNPPARGLNVTREAVEGHPAEVLLRAARAADLLVVGSHGHGQFIGTLLGSISQQVVAHALCPVVVVPSEQRQHRATLGHNDPCTDL